jgi:sugar-specific transcriptional regulator TrmB
MEKEDLIKAGLTKTESEVYLNLLKHGESSASQIAKRLRMDRTVTYHIIQNLERKGLISYMIKNHKRTYDATDPENLLGPIKAQEEYVQQLIPQLQNLKKIKEKEQEVLVYDGKEGIRTLYTDILKTGSFLAYGATGKSFDIMKWEMPHIVDKFAKLKSSIKVVCHTDHKSKKLTKELSSIVDFRFLDSVESQASTLIYGDNVGIVSFGDKPLTIIIRNKVIAESYRNHFNLLWKLSKK